MLSKLGGTPDHKIPSASKTGIDRINVMARLRVMRCKQARRSARIERPCLRIECRPEDTGDPLLVVGDGKSRLRSESVETSSYACMFRGCGDHSRRAMPSQEPIVVKLEFECHESLSSS